MRAMALALLLMGLAAMPNPARAEVTGNDLLIAARALGFIKPPPSGPVRVGIVYAADAPASAAEARELARLMGDGLEVASFDLIPVMVTLDAVGGADVGLYFLTRGIGAGGTKVAAAAKAKQIPCITFDIEQVRNGDCAIGVRTEPHIEILVNRQAADSSGTAFAAMFSLMITEF